MTDILVTTLDYDETPLGRIRSFAFEMCMERWAMESDKVGIITCPKGNELAFQRERRIAADEQATSDIYILADDDCLLGDPYPHLKPAVDIMQRHPEFAILSWLGVNFNIVPWTPPDEETKYLVGGTHYTDDEVMEHVNCGGIRLCRKGAMKEWPPMDDGVKTYDMIHCRELRRQGWRSGYFQKLRMLHLGKNYSMLSNCPEEMLR
jgi:hypothetical protein